MRSTNPKTAVSIFYGGAEYKRKEIEGNSFTQVNKERIFCQI